MDLPTSFTSIALASVMGRHLTTLSASMFTSPPTLDSFANRSLLTALVAINSEIAGVMHTIYGSMH